MPKSTVVVGLVRPRVSAETLRAVDYLRQEILAGRIVGLSWVAQRPGYQYEVDVAGEARTLPAFTQGTVIKLLKEIGKLPER